MVWAGWGPAVGLDWRTVVAPFQVEINWMAAHFPALRSLSAGGAGVGALYRRTCSCTLALPPHEATWLTISSLSPQHCPRDSSWYKAGV